MGKLLKIKVYDLDNKEVEDLSVPGSSGIIIAVSFFSGILLTNIGIIGIYVARIFEQVKGRSQYIIKDIKDFKTTKE